MIEGRDIVCFGTDWGRHPDSCQHILRRFMPKNRVLWVNSTGLRAPSFSLADLKRGWTKVVRRRAPRENGPAGPVAIYNPRVLPFYGSRLANAFNRWTMARHLRAKLRELDFHRIIVWTSMPTSSLVMDKLSPELVVYYCMDDYPLFPGVNAKAIRELERRVFEQSDIVLATADHLVEVKAGLGKPITVLPHGVDYEHFHGPRPRPPKELASIPHPIVGFFGLVAPWIDVRMMAAVARKNPAVSFVFVGDVQTDVRDLEAQPNVHLLPKVSYDELPRYARQFDVTTLPFLIDDMTVNVNPLKLMEYFALGVPTVSTRLPEVEKYQPHARIADTADAFSDAIHAVLAGDTEERRQARLAIAQAMSWDSRAEAALLAGGR